MDEGMSQRLTPHQAHPERPPSAWAGDVSVLISIFPGVQKWAGEHRRETTEDAKAQVPARIKIGSQPG